MQDKKHYTLITQFDEVGYGYLASSLKRIGERVCRVPYGRVPDEKRYAADNLPYHITVAATVQQEDELLQKLDSLSFKPFKVEVQGLDVMGGKKDSQVLYYKIGESTEFDDLQWRACHILQDGNHLPGMNVPHITIAISRDHAKIERLKQTLEQDFKPFTLRVEAVSLYQIWPGVLLREYKAIG